MKDVETRNVNMDIMRSTALFLVVSVHFFLWNGFYSMEMQGVSACIMSVIRTVSMSCVPLFLLISGYLLSERDFIPVKKEYFRKLLYLLFVYVVCTLILVIFRRFILHEEAGLFDMIKNFFSFSQYSWYVAMYAGLYLLIPFLNLLWKNTENKKDERILVSSLILITALPSLFNIKETIIPEVWTGIYPVTYYFIGAYIKRREDEIRIRGLLLTLFWIILLVIFGVFNFFISGGGRFGMGAWNDWGALQNIVLSVLLFLMITKIPAGSPEKKIWALLKKMSGLTYAAFLLSYISDIVAWKLFKDIVPVENKLTVFLPAVLLSFVLSMIMSFAVTYCTEYVFRKKR